MPAHLASSRAVRPAYVVPFVLLVDEHPVRSNAVAASTTQTLTDDAVRTSYATKDETMSRQPDEPAIGSPSRFTSSIVT